MKLIHRSLAFLALSMFTFTARAEEGVADLPIGAPAPDFALPGIDGKTHTLAEYKDGKMLMIFFTSNHCPTSHGVGGAVEEVPRRFPRQGPHLRRHQSEPSRRPEHR